MHIKILPLTVLALLTGCSSPCAPNLSPLGGGLTAIAICMVVSSVVRSLTKLVTRKKSAPPSTGHDYNPSPREE